MSLGTKIYTWLKGNLVGSDDLGNKYYSSSKDFKDLKAKRWVIFNGEIEASNIPPHWHAWLHKSIDNPPIDYSCLLYTSPSPRDKRQSRMPSSA